MSDVLQQERDGGVAILTLNRPDVLNAFNDDLGHALRLAVEECARDESVRCIVITGAGRAFCSGEDLSPLKGVYEQGQAPDLGNTIADRYNPLIRSIRSAPKPVVAAVNGVAAGAGASLALACDFRIAAERAKLLFAFVKVGLVPDSGGVWFLANMIGTANTWQLASSGEPLGAERAAAMGVFDKVLPPDDFEPGWRSFAAKLAAGPTRAYALTKTLVHSAPDRTLEEQLELEIEAQTTAGKTSDHLEGVQAFFDKRPPNFEGR